MPLGLSAKLWIDRNNALEGIAAWSLNRGVFSLNVDYLLNFPDISCHGEIGNPLVLLIAPFSICR